MQKLGLTDTFHSCAPFKKFFKLLVALAFIDPANVADLFSHLVDHNWPIGLAGQAEQQVEKFVTYFYQFWIKTVPIVEWSVYTIFDHRTNNFVENRHLVLLKKFRDHPNVWDFVRILINTHSRQQDTEQAHRQGGALPSRRRRPALDLEARLKNLRSLYTSNPPQLNDLEYIDAISELKVTEVAAVPVEEDNDD